MTELEKIIAGEADINDYSIECDFDNDEIEKLLFDDIIRPSDISQSRASDLIIDGVLDYDAYPFDNFSSYEQLRQLEHGAISKDDFMKQADSDSFNEQEKEWLKEILETCDGN